MNPLKKGPELKLSSLKDVKVPQVLSDLYWDLRDRYLLPAVVILLVAIVAVPLALGGASNSNWEDTVSEAEVTEEIAGASTVAPAGGELVAKAAPGLRDYRRRLNELEEKDPFVQQFAETEASSAPSTETVETGGGGASSSAPETASPSFPSSPSSPSPSPADEGTATPGKTTYYSYAVDVRISSGGAESGEEKKITVRRNLPELTMLPSRKTPAIVYMGSTKDGKKAVMTVSSDVEAMFGDSKCVLGTETCQLLAMEPGLPETFVYGDAGRTFTIELLKTHLVESDKLNRAPLGKPKQGKEKAP